MLDDLLNSFVSAENIRLIQSISITPAYTAINLFLLQHKSKNISHSKSRYKNHHRFHTTRTRFPGYKTQYRTITIYLIYSISNNSCLFYTYSVPPVHVNPALECSAMLIIIALIRFIAYFISACYAHFLYHTVIMNTIRIHFCLCSLFLIFGISEDRAKFLMNRIFVIVTCFCCEFTHTFTVQWNSVMTKSMEIKVSQLIIRTLKICSL